MVEGVEDGTRGVPGLNTVTAALHNARAWCEERPFIILDGWDDDNMVDPEEFRILLEALEGEDCKIFLTSRSVLDATRTRIRAINLSLWMDEDAPQHRLEVMQYVKRLHQTIPKTVDIKGSLHNFQLLLRPKAVAELSYGS
jgi:cob(I)alamin adenosyltransferase